jgi:restriction system protein
MALPDYQTIMLPLLKFASDEKEHSIHEAINVLADQFNLSQEERRELLPSGQQEVFVNRVGWARTYLKKSGLLDAPKRGVLKITSRGKKILQSNPTEINNKILSQFDEFKEFKAKRRKQGDDLEESGEQVKTPEEAFESAYENLRTEISIDILDHLKNVTRAYLKK